MKFGRKGLASSTELEIAEVQVKYSSYVSVHGELFEDAWVQMTPDDFENAKAQKQRFLKTWWIGFIAMIIILSAVIVFGNTPRDSDWFYISMFPLGVMAFRMIKLNQYKNALDSREKHVVRGVITSKQLLARLYGNKKKNMRDGFYIEFSGQSLIRVRSEEYRSLTLGDIVRMEMLSDDIYMKKKLVVEGKI